MNQILSEVLFNRALIWLVMASMVNDNSWFKGACFVLALFSVVKSLRAYAREDE